MKVPFLDLKAQYQSIRDEIHAAIQQVLNDAAFVGGPYVAQFEKEFASFCKCSNAVGVGSGTDALWLTLLALGVGQGDEVITVPNTFIATAEAISYCGAKPVFVDVDERTYNMDPNKLEDCIKSRFAQCAMRSANRLKAIIPVHLFGQMADMDPILQIARRHGLLVIEDACQAHGAEYKGRLAGSIGDAGCFSFYPGKNLGAYGEGGAVVTNNNEVASKIRMLRDHGQDKKYYHGMIGWNGRMDGFQGAILSVKLKRLGEWNDARRRNAHLYSKLLTNVSEVIIPQEANYAKHIYHIYPIRVRDRFVLMKELTGKDITCGIHYPVPIHLQDAYQNMGLRKGSFPIAERCAEEFISLPMFPELAKEQIEYVVDQIKKYLQ